VARCERVLNQLYPSRIRVMLSVLKTHNKGGRAVASSSANHAEVARHWFGRQDARRCLRGVAWSWSEPARRLPHSRAASGGLPAARGTCGYLFGHRQIVMNRLFKRKTLDTRVEPPVSNWCVLDSGQSVAEAESGTNRPAAAAGIDQIAGPPATARLSVDRWPRHDGGTETATASARSPAMCCGHSSCRCPARTGQADSLRRQISRRGAFWWRAAVLPPRRRPRSCCERCAKTRM
jgi:hypothetical protein